MMLRYVCLGFFCILVFRGCIPLNQGGRIPAWEPHAASKLFLITPSPSNILLKSDCQHFYNCFRTFFKKNIKSYYFNSLGHKWLPSPVIEKGHDLFHNQPNIAESEVAAFGGHQAAFFNQAKDSPRLGNVKEQAELESRLKQIISLDSLCCHKIPKLSLS